MTRMYSALILVAAVTSIQSSHALDFAFKSGVATKVSFDSSFPLSSGGYARKATLSDATGHTEKIDMTRAFTCEGGGGDEYYGSRINGADGKKIDIEDQWGQARRLFDQLAHLERVDDAIKAQAKKQAISAQAQEKPVIVPEKKTEAASVAHRKRRRGLEYELAWNMKK